MIGKKYRWLIGAGLTAVMLLTLPMPSTAEVVKKYDPSLGRQDLTITSFQSFVMHDFS